MMRRLRVGYVLASERAILISTQEYVSKYATKDAADEAGAESDDDDDMSSVGSYGDDDEEPAGEMEDV
jgi:hypothetical protein